MTFDREILDMIARLEAAGHEAYIVGGSLRDRLLGREAFDVDMTTSALPEETAALFSDLRVIPTGIKHGTVTVLTPSGAPVEITTYRTDGSYSDSRHPDSVTFTRSLPDDLARRDFTVNAMAYAPEKGVVDLFGGKEDLRDGVIRCVGLPEKRFSEDALRILRAFRFSAQLGFSIEKETLDAAIRLGSKISDLARERVATELLKLLSAPRVTATLAMMEPVLPFVLPEADIESERFALCDLLPADPIARLAILIAGGDSNAVARSLRLSTAEKIRLRDLSETKAVPKTEAEARRMLASCASAEDCILNLTVSHLLRGEDPSEATALVSRAAEGNPCLSIADLAVGGEDLIGLGIEKGKMLGETLHRLLDAVIDDPSLNKRERLLALAETMKNSLANK